MVLFCISVDGGVMFGGWDVFGTASLGVKQDQSNKTKKLVINHVTWNIRVHTVLRASIFLLEHY